MRKVLAPVHPRLHHSDDDNAYGYANNNPIAFSDPSGLCATAGDDYRGGPGAYTATDGFNQWMQKTKVSASGAVYQRKWSEFGQGPGRKRDIAAGLVGGIAGLVDFAAGVNPNALAARAVGVETPSLQDLTDRWFGADRMTRQYQRGESLSMLLPFGWASGGRAAAKADDAADAASGGRVFSSADPHVADAANAVEAALPGRIVSVNGQRTMVNGLKREVDIDLGNLLVQVKSGNARGLTGQIARTQSSTGLTTVGYAPEISNAAWRNAATRGVPILRSPDELLAYIREFG